MLVLPNSADRWCGHIPCTVLVSLLWLLPECALPTADRRCSCWKEDYTVSPYNWQSVSWYICWIQQGGWHSSTLLYCLCGKCGHRIYAHWFRLLLHSRYYHRCEYAFLSQGIFYRLYGLRERIRLRTGRYRQSGNRMVSSFFELVWYRPQSYNKKGKKL